MPSNLASYLNKTILVAIPALFDDGVCRPFTLLGAELHGLWLQSDELTQRLLPADKRELGAAAAAAVFVPFAQIAGVLVAYRPAPGQQPEGSQSRSAAGDRMRTKSAARDAAAAPKK
jgi:hypothetical protein